FSLCKLSVLRVSVVGFSSSSPRRRRDHGGCTERVRLKYSGPKPKDQNLSSFPIHPPSTARISFEFEQIFQFRQKGNYREESINHGAACRGINYAGEPKCLCTNEFDGRQSNGWRGADVQVERHCGQCRKLR